MNDHAEPVSAPSEPSIQRLWYLPHHCVPKKNNKIRLVFDCASRYQVYLLMTDVTKDGTLLINYR